MPAFIENIANNIIVYNKIALETQDIEEEEDIEQSRSPQNKLTSNASKISYADHSESVTGRYKSNKDESTRGHSQLGNQTTDRIIENENSNDMYLKANPEILDLHKVKRSELMKSRDLEFTVDHDKSEI